MSPEKLAALLQLLARKGVDEAMADVRMPKDGRDGSSGKDGLLDRSSEDIWLKQW